ncbi:hypothetical protein KBC55_00685 [Patescibacteria group bacterium]|nr:hypothetical protein [Patescibacteria group bacterium]
MQKNSGSEALSAIAEEARQHGKELAELLNASPISDDEKAAWATLIPAMDATALGQLEAVLKKKLQELAADAFEEQIITIRASEARRHLEEAAITTDFVHALDDLEAEFLAAEEAGSKE